MNISDLLQDKIKAKLNKWGIQNYKIQPTLLIDVDGNVVIKEKMSKLPLSFGTVTGNFVCENVGLTTLKGCPQKVGEDFNCENNPISSLRGGPRYVEGCYWCLKGIDNLNDVVGLPQYVGGLAIISISNLSEEDKKKVRNLIES